MFGLVGFAAPATKKAQTYLDTEYRYIRYVLRWNAGVKSYSYYKKTFQSTLLSFVVACILQIAFHKYL